VRELRDAAQQLDVVNRLTSFGAALKTLEEPSTMKAHFFLLKLDPVARTVDIGGFPARELEKANDAYIAAERSGVDAVLVAVQSLELLRRAYPNYFLDTNVFLEALKEAIK
jgi:hypothetical protein